VESESVFNDGTGIVVFAIAVDFVSRPVGPLEVTFAFVSVVVISSVLGAVTGYVASRLIPYVGDHLIEISLSVVLAYGTYLIADAAHQSGVIATAVAGIVLGNYGRRHGLSEVTEESLTTVWDFIAYLATAFVFLVVGFAIAAHSLVDVAPAIAWAIAATLVGRALIVYVLLGAWRVAREKAGAARDGRGGATGVVELLTDLPARIRPRAEPFPLKWFHVVFWSGLRGAVSTALALSLPIDFPDRAELQGITFGVVLFTLVVQATTAEWVVGRWGVPQPSRSVGGTPTAAEASR
jgi:CPA1 family monovalent cation:H+ antiporter